MRTISQLGHLRYLFLGFIILRVLSFPVFAQQVSLSLSPPLIELKIKSGKSLLIAYSLKNSGDPSTLTPYVLPFEPSGQLGNIALKDTFEGPIRFNLDNKNLKLNEPFFFKNNQEGQLLLRIRIPEGTPEGDYYYTLLVESKPSQATEGSTGSVATATIGSNMLITVTNDGATSVQSSVSEFSVLPHYKIKIFGKTYNIYDSSDIVPVRLVVSNSGKNLITPQGTITLKGPLNSKSKYQILPQNILAESQRLLHATPSAQLNKTTSLNLKGFFIGKYDVNGQLNFGESTPTLISNVSFYGIPIKYAIGTILASIVIVVIIKKFKDQSP